MHMKSRFKAFMQVLVNFNVSLCAPVRACLDICPVRYRLWL